MQENIGQIKKRLCELFESGTVNRVIAWKNGEFCYDNTPCVFETAEQIKDLTYNSFCACNLSKYLISESKKDGKIAALLKPCDTYGLNQLLTEHRIDRQKVYVIGVGCSGMADIEKIKAFGIKGITSIEQDGDEFIIETVYGQKKCKTEQALLDKCLACKGKEHKIYDELIGGSRELPAVAQIQRFAETERIEKMPHKQRFGFWQKELSKCIRCNACRDICPVCSCNKCVFDNAGSGIEAKVNADTFEDKMFHIIRAFHVAGRCTDCGECSRVCPQKIPLNLLNRKIIKDINEFYGEYQAGEREGMPSPLTSYDKNDAEPDIIRRKNAGGKDYAEN